MSFLNNIGDAVGGAVQHAYSGASQASSGGNWWDSGVSFGVKAFDWLDNNPQAANLLGGVAAGAGTYLAQRSQQKRSERFESDMMDKRRREREIRAGDTSGYGSHTNIAGQGLLTRGMVLDREGR